LQLHAATFGPVAASKQDGTTNPGISSAAAGSELHGTSGAAGACTCND
jgi:hypothetical protein